MYSDGGLPGASAEAAAGASAVGSAATAGTPASPLVSPAAEPPPGVYSDGGLPGASAEAAAGASAVGSAATVGCRSRRSFLRRRSRHLACILTGPERRLNRAGGAHSPRFCPQPPPIPASASHSCGCPATRMATRRWTLLLSRSAQPGAAAPLLICSRPTTCCQSPKAAARTCSTYNYSAFSIAACATATGRLCRRSAPCSASSALLARRSTRLANGLQVDVARRDPLRISARRACISPPHHQTLAVGYTVYEPPASGDRHHRQPPATIRSAAPLAHRL